MCICVCVAKGKGQGVIHILSATCKGRGKGVKVESATWCTLWGVQSAHLGGGEESPVFNSSGTLSEKLEYLYFSHGYSVLFMNII
jgi:hypothetical protein